MRIAVIENSHVSNVILGDQTYADSLTGTFVILEESSICNIGDMWQGGQNFVKPAADLTALKLAKNLEINQWRADANLTTFPHAGKLVACDALSRSDIEGVAGNISLMGAFPAGFPNGWKAVDNTIIPLPTIQSFKDMYASMTLQGTLNFARSQELKQALNLAQTPEAIAAIKW